MATMKDTKMQPAKDAVIEELRNRLEEARTAWKEADKACRDLTEKVIPNLRESLEAAEKERDTLRAKIKQMEKQEPGFRERCTPSAPTGGSNRFPLYTLPGAKTQGEEK